MANVDVALWYAEEMGWEVLPLHTPDEHGRCSCSARDCRSAGKHPRTPHGYYDASKDKKQILDWWREWPDANVGLAAGEKSGVIVIDVDPRNGGTQTLKEQPTKPPSDLVAITGGGGRHYFVAYSSDPIASKIGRGIDVQGDRRIVVLMPSMHTSGQKYKWFKKPSPGMRLPDPPDWLFESAQQSNGSKPADRQARFLYEGERNEELFKFGCRLRRMGSLEPEIFAALRIRNKSLCVPPLEQHEVEAIAHSCMRYPTAYGVSDARQSAAQDGYFRLTDKGNAQRLQAQVGDEYKYDRAQGWWKYTGKVWALLGTGPIREQAAMLSDLVQQEAGERDLDDKELKRWHRWVEASESDRVITSTVNVFKDMAGIRIDALDWDADHFLFNVQNGTLDLRTGQLREHDRDDNITKMSPAVFDPKAKAPRFQRFLRETFRGDEELISYLQKLFGYSMTGEVSEQIFAVFWGTGGNGKSKLLENAIQSVFGTAYMVFMSPSVLLEKRYQGHPTELMDLLGARLAVAVETGRRRMLDEEMIKSLTGGDTISAHRMHKDQVHFKPTHQLVLVTNNKPRSSASDAIARRLKLVPFLYKVPQELREKNLDKVLESEASGILNWLLEGCLLWQKEGLPDASAVAEMTSAHLEDQDILGAFFKEEVEFGKKLNCSMSELYQAYQAWAVDGGVRALLGKISFNREVRDRFPDVKKYTSSGQTKWRGLVPRVIVKQ